MQDSDKEKKTLQLLNSVFTLDKLIVQCLGGKCRFVAWDPVTGTTKTIFHGRKEVLDAFLIPNAKPLFTTGKSGQQIGVLTSDTNLCFYDLKSGEEVEEKRTRLKRYAPNNRLNRIIRINDEKVMVIPQLNYHFTAQAVVYNINEHRVKSFNLNGEILHEKPISGKFVTSNSIFNTKSLTSVSNPLQNLSCCELDEKRAAVCTSDQLIKIINLSEDNPKTEREIPDLSNDFFPAVNCLPDSPYLLVSYFGQPRIQVINWKTGEKLVGTGDLLIPGQMHMNRKKIWILNDNHFLFALEQEKKYQIWRFFTSSSEGKEEKVTFKLVHETKISLEGVSTLSVTPYSNGRWIVMRGQGVYLCDEKNFEGVKMGREKWEKVNRLPHCLIVNRDPECLAKGQKGLISFEAKVLRVLLVRNLNLYLPKDLILETFDFFLNT
jgi:hypothetical protein